MTIPNLATQEGAENYGAFVLDATRKMFEEFGRVQLTVHILATRAWGGVKIPHGGVGILVVTPESLKDNAEKDRVSYTLRRTITATRAIGVILVMECWMLQGDPRLAGEMRRLKALKTIEHEPGRTEHIRVDFEHIRGRWTKSALITRDAQGKGSLGLFEDIPAAEGGRFWGLLHRERFA